MKQYSECNLSPASPTKEPTVSRWNWATTLPVMSSQAALKVTYATLRWIVRGDVFCCSPPTSIPACGLCVSQQHCAFSHSTATTYELVKVIQVETNIGETHWISSNLVNERSSSVSQNTSWKPAQRPSGSPFICSLLRSSALLFMQVKPYLLLFRFT